MVDEKGTVWAMFLYLFELELLCLILCAITSCISIEYLSEESCENWPIKSNGQSLDLDHLDPLVVGNSSVGWHLQCPNT